jgi:hypothetical protein
MTFRAIPQMMHHQNLVHEEKRDFHEYGREEKKCGAMVKASKFEQVLVETMCWRALLTAKELKKN